MTRLPDDVPDPELGEEPGGERGGVDIEAAWAQIVANWSEEAVGHALPTTPQRVADDGEDRLLDVTDVTDPLRTRRATDVPGAARPAAARQPVTPGDPTEPVAGDDPTGYTDYPTRQFRHRLTPEEVAELGEESWDADADRPTDDRRSTDDWRRTPRSPSTSHVGGEEARSGTSASLEDDGSDGFVPPEPGPMPLGDIISRLAWAGALGAPLFLLVAALVWQTAPPWLVGVAVVAFIAGFVTLVVRMPDRSDDEDDGAVV